MSDSQKEASSSVLQYERNLARNSISQAVDVIIILWSLHAMILKSPIRLTIINGQKDISANSFRSHLRFFYLLTRAWCGGICETLDKVGGFVWAQSYRLLKSKGAEELEGNYVGNLPNSDQVRVEFYFKLELHLIV